MRVIVLDDGGIGQIHAANVATSPLSVLIRRPMRQQTLIGFLEKISVHGAFAARDNMVVAWIFMVAERGPLTESDRLFVAMFAPDSAFRMWLRLPEVLVLLSVSSEATAHTPRGS